MGTFLMYPRFAILTSAETDEEHALLELVAPLEWHNEEILIKIEPGFVCDGASVPKILYLVIDANALDLAIPGFGHDYLYRIGADVMDNEVGWRHTNRHEADEVLRELCEDVGVDWDDRQKIYYGVRVGGGDSYQQKPIDWRPGGV